MGSIVQPICSCNHPFNELLLGGGMMDRDEKCFVPYSCETCGTITRKNGLNEIHKCGKCKNQIEMIGEFISVDDGNKESGSGKYIFTWGINYNKFYGLEDKFYKCPKCKSQNLQFIDSGCWD